MKKKNVIMEREIFRKSVRDMQPYNPPLEGRSQEGFLRLDFNERTIPPDRLVREAVGKYVGRGEFQIYPEYGDIDKIVADYAKVKPSEVLPVNGSDQAIDIIYRGLVNEGDRV